MSEIEGDTTNGGGGGRRGLRIFRRADAPNLMESGVMSMPTMEPDATEQLIEWGASGGEVVKVLFADPEGSGMSLVCRHVTLTGTVSGLTRSTGGVVLGLELTLTVTGSSGTHPPVRGTITATGTTDQTGGAGTTVETGEFTSLLRTRT